ncbi:MAG: hypothetical protein WD341_02140 [Tistlia sp.]|uniref:hypothetical protein n=1 Tax=Tistlia sp. TaxID=3057121 RepID=UPI0034A32C98
MARTGERGQGPREYSGDKARQGEVILKARWQRVVFVAGLVGLALVLLLAGSFG